MKLSVLSWNLHGLPWPLSKDPRGRLQRAGAKIRELAPDIVMLQEIWSGWAIDSLSRALHPDWSACCVRGRLGRANGGLLTLVRVADRWVVRGRPEFHRYNSSAPAWKIWEGDGLSGKGALIVSLEHNGEKVVAVNTHLQAEYPGSDYSSVREAQLSQLAEFVAALEQSVPAIIAGDFNTDCREPLYARIAEMGIDLTADGRGERGTNFDLRDGKPVWIDYILGPASKSWKAAAELQLIANRGVDDPYSDHNGLFCAVTLTLRK